MGMGTQGKTPNPGEARQAPGNADPDPRTVPDGPKSEMQPQDGTDRSLDIEALREEARRMWPGDAAYEKRDAKSIIGDGDK